MKEKSYKYLDNFKKYVLPLVLALFFWSSYKRICDFLIFRNFFDIVTSIMLGGLFTILLIFIISFFLYSFKVNSIDKRKSISTYKWIYISITVGIILYVGNVIFYDLIYYGLLNFSRSVNDKMLDSLLKSNYIMENISLIVITPILEELIFRQFFFGVLYDIYEGCNKYIRFFTAVLISGICFGLVHRINIISISMITYLVYSLAFSWLYVYTKNIKSAILLHSMFYISIVFIELFSYFF